MEMSKACANWVEPAFLLGRWSFVVENPANLYRLISPPGFIIAAITLSPKNPAQFRIRFYTVNMTMRSDPATRFLTSTKHLLLLGVLFCNLQLSSADSAVISRINHSVERFLQEFHAGRVEPGHRIEVSVGYIDPRLNLPDCSTELDLALNGSQQGLGKLQVKVSCMGTQPWTKYVPAEVHLYGEVLVATENIRRGTLIEARHLRLRETDLAALRRAPVVNPDRVIGMELKYPLTTGGAFSLEGLAKPVVVQRGDLVQLVAESKNLRIKQQGEALQDGALGKVINVRNNSSDMVVQAEVVGSGKVKVQL